MLLDVDAESGVLERLKHRAAHAPPAGASRSAAPATRQSALRSGAAAFVEDRRATLDAALVRPRRVPRPARRATCSSSRTTTTSATRSPSSSAARASRSPRSASSDEALERARVAALRLHRARPQAAEDARASSCSRRSRATSATATTPVIIHTGKALTRREETRLQRYAETIIVKDAGSPERLLAETSLFLHRPESSLPDEDRRRLESMHQADAVLQGRTVLIVDDDVRNVFALTSALEARGMVVRFAENGREAIESAQGGRRTSTSS